MNIISKGTKDVNSLTNIYNTKHICDISTHQNSDHILLFHIFGHLRPMWLMGYPAVSHQHFIYIIKVDGSIMCVSVKRISEHIPHLMHITVTSNRSRTISK